MKTITPLKNILTSSKKAAGVLQKQRKRLKPKYLKIANWHLKKDKRRLKRKNKKRKKITNGKTNQIDQHLVNLIQ